MPLHGLAKPCMALHSFAYPHTPRKSSQILRMPSQGLTPLTLPCIASHTFTCPFRSLHALSFLPHSFTSSPALHDPACPCTCSHTLAHSCTASCTCTSFHTLARHHTPLHTLECPPMPLHTHMDLHALCPLTHHMPACSRIFLQILTHPCQGLNILTLPAHSHKPSHAPSHTPVQPLHSLTHPLMPSDALDCLSLTHISQTATHLLACTYIP